MLFFRRHYEWLAAVCAELVDTGLMTEEGVVRIMGKLQTDNPKFKPKLFWEAYSTTPKAE